jgi:hypothetical protein
MRVLPPVEEEIRRSIREMRAKDPLFTVSHLRDALAEKFNKGISRKYVAKRADKVARQGVVDIDRMRIEERLDFTRQNYHLTRKELLKTDYWNPDAASLDVASRSPATASRPPRTL